MYFALDEYVVASPLLVSFGLKSMLLNIKMAITIKEC